MDVFSIDRKKLYDEIWEMSVRKVAEKYAISYTRLLSKCRECNIPIPPSGYLTKRQFGKPVTQTPLPKSDIENVVIECPKPRKTVQEPSAIPVDNITIEEAPPMNQDQTDSFKAADENNDASKVPLGRYVDPQQTLREELFRKVWEYPISEVSKEYGISNVALHKRCIKLGVPVPERGVLGKSEGREACKQTNGSTGHTATTLHKAKDRCSAGTPYPTGCVILYAGGWAERNTVSSGTIGGWRPTYKNAGFH